MNFFDTVEALEDRHAVVKESMHGDQMVLLSKAQETEDKMLTMMERQAEVLKRQMERQDEVSAQRQDRQDEVSAQREWRQDERQTTFQNGFLEVLSQLVKANRSSSLLLPLFTMSAAEPIPTAGTVHFVLLLLILTHNFALRCVCC